MIRSSLILSNHKNNYKYDQTFWLTYVMNIVFHVSAAVVDMVGSYTFSLVRAMLTCCVPLNEFGKIYSVIAALDNLLPIGLSQAYATVWKVRLQRFPKRLDLKLGKVNFFPICA